MKAEIVQNAFVHLNLLGLTDPTKTELSTSMPNVQTKVHAIETQESVFALQVMKEKDAVVNLVLHFVMGMELVSL